MVKLFAGIDPSLKVLPPPHQVFTDEETENEQPEKSANNTAKRKKRSKSESTGPQNKRSRPRNEKGNQIMSALTTNEPCKNGQNLGKGALVEVSSDKDGFRGAWFAATILEECGSDKYLIEYNSLTKDDGTEPLKETVSSMHLRPYPPETAAIGHFRLLEQVDALHNDGWWVGVISKVNVGQRYVVYFKGTNEEIVFKKSDLRPHQDWIDGKWVMASQALKLRCLREVQAVHCCDAK